ncbi:MAG TPA: universal stress protein [Caldimonas sp.]|nr:universal stress protein [Caldimonas sp.]
MYRLILVPLDSSETAQHGFEEALALARTLGSTLRIVNIVDMRLLPAEISAHASVGQLLEDWREAGQRLIAAAAARARACGVNTEEAVLCDPGLRVSDLIVEEARRCGAGLIVMGTHGRRGLRRMTLGSDAELVVREAPVPVMLVRSAHAAAGEAEAARAA